VRKIVSGLYISLDGVIENLALHGEAFFEIVHRFLYLVEPPGRLQSLAALQRSGLTSKFYLLALQLFDAGLRTFQIIFRAGDNSL